MSTLNLSPEPEQEKIKFEPDNQDLLNRVRRGANWFYWIAALSLVNSLIFAFGGNVSFIAGLGITQVIDAIASVVVKQNGVEAIKFVAVFFDLAIAALIAGCGVFSNKMLLWAFVAGIILYALDTILILFLGDFLSVAFHCYALFMIFRGFMAARNLKAAQSAMPLA